MRVSALRRSLRVPPERMLRRKARSDAEPPVDFGKAEKVESSDACKEEARVSKVAIWETDWETTGPEVVGSGGRKSNQPGDAGTSSLVLEDETVGLLGMRGGMAGGMGFSSSGHRLPRLQISNSVLGWTRLNHAPFTISPGLWQTWIKPQLPSGLYLHCEKHVSVR